MQKKSPEGSPKRIGIEENPSDFHNIITDPRELRKIVSKDRSQWIWILKIPSVCIIACKIHKNFSKDPPQSITILQSPTTSSQVTQRILLNPEGSQKIPHIITDNSKESRRIRPNGPYRPEGLHKSWSGSSYHRKDPCESGRNPDRGFHKTQQQQLTELPFRNDSRLSSVFLQPSLSCSCFNIDSGDYLYTVVNVPSLHEMSIKEFIKRNSSG